VHTKTVVFAVSEAVTPSSQGHGLKTGDLSTRISQRAQSLRQERSNPRLGFMMPLRSPRTLR